MELKERERQRKEWLDQENQKLMKERELKAKEKEKLEMEIKERERRIKKERNDQEYAERIERYLKEAELKRKEAADREMKEKQLQEREKQWQEMEKQSRLEAANKKKIETERKDKERKDKARNARLERELLDLGEDEGEDKDNKAEDDKCMGCLYPNDDGHEICKLFAARPDLFRRRAIRGQTVVCHDCISEPRNHLYAAEGNISCDCGATFECSGTERRERNCGNIRFCSGKDAEINREYASQFNLWGSPWCAHPLSLTLNADSISFLPFEDILQERPPASLIAPPAISSCGQRPLAGVWACDGTKRSCGVGQESTPKRQWRVVILLSYPVNERSFLLSADGSKVCRTLQMVFKYLGGCEDLEQVLITDIFPFVGHPSAIGRQRLGIHGTQMVNRAKEILNLKPCLILTAGAAARWAIATALTEQGIVPNDCTQALGIPSCVFPHYTPTGALQTLLLVEPHPSLAGLTTFKPCFKRRAEFVCGVLSGSLEGLAADGGTKEGNRGGAERDASGKDVAHVNTERNPFGMSELCEVIGWKQESFTWTTRRTTPTATSKGKAKSTRQYRGHNPREAPSFICENCLNEAPTKTRYHYPDQSQRTKVYICSHCYGKLRK